MLPVSIMLGARPKAKPRAALSTKTKIIALLLLANEIRGAIFVGYYLWSTGGQLILPTFN